MRNLGKCWSPASLLTPTNLISLARLARGVRCALPCGVVDVLLCGGMFVFVSINVRGLRVYASSFSHTQFSAAPAGEPPACARRVRSDDCWLERFETGPPI